MTAPKVVIVGAGVIGLTCAVALARTGARVTLLEGEKEERGPASPTASLTAAGMLSPLGEAALEETHPDALTLAYASFDLWRERAKGAAWEDAVHFDGAALIARDGAHQAEMLELARANGRDAAPLSKSEWTRRVGIEAPDAPALFVADEGVADCERALSGLLIEARRLGVQACFNCEAEKVSRAARRVVAFDGRAFEADAIVLAPGIWGERLAQFAPALAHVSPAKGHLVPVTTYRPLRLTVRAPDFYLARRGEGEVLLGATMEPGRFDRAVDKARVRDLLGAVERSLPNQARPAVGALPRAGVRPMSPDGIPIVGLSGEAIVAAGHGRNGWLLAPITADIVTAYVYGEAMPAAWAALSPDRLDTQPEKQ